LVLANYPNVYLYGALIHLAQITGDIRGAGWSAAFEDYLAKAKAKEARSKASSTLSTEVGILGRSTRRHGFNINVG
jgi:hypothetical protein